MEPGTHTLDVLCLFDISDQDQDNEALQDDENIVEYGNTQITHEFVGGE